jgi:cation transport protein ChaC
MGLTRADFEDDRLRQQLRRNYPGFMVLSEAELEASLETTLAAQPDPGPIWVFGYGSLIWNPLFHFAERRLARLNGFHRRFCIWSRAYRGTPQQPGLVLGLDAGGACRGVVYRLAPDLARQELTLLWRREMVSSAYRARWLKVSTMDGKDGEEVYALAFVVNRDNPGYAGKMPVEKVLSVMTRACGHAGTPAEYLFETVKGLQAHGVRDAYLLDIKRRLGEMGCTASTLPHSSPATAGAEMSNASHAAAPSSGDEG